MGNTELGAFGGDTTDNVKAKIQQRRYPSRPARIRPHPDYHIVVDIDSKQCGYAQWNTRLPYLVPGTNSHTGRGVNNLSYPGGSRNLDGSNLSQMARRVFLYLGWLSLLFIQSSCIKRFNTTIWTHRGFSYSLYQTRPGFDEPVIGMVLNRLSPLLRRGPSRSQQIPRHNTAFFFCYGHVKTSKSSNGSERLRLDLVYWLYQAFTLGAPFVTFFTPFIVVMRPLPLVQKVPAWDQRSGLVVTLLNRPLPAVTVVDEDSTDYFNPRLVRDDRIYWGFYPRMRPFRSTLFRQVGLSDNRLAESIEHVTGLGYRLKKPIQDNWIKLERLLVRIGDILLREKTQTPYVQPPHLPRAEGYRSIHGERAIAFASVKASRDAFAMLSAYVTFAFVLHIGEFDNSCFDVAFDILACHPTHPTPHAMLELVRNSIICDISPGLRTGFFLNPYDTEWSAYLKEFTRAAVPVWILWGQPEMYAQPHTTVRDRYIYDHYFPSQQLLSATQSRQATYSTLILPAPPRPLLPHGTGGEQDYPLPEFVDSAHATIDRTTIVDTSTGQRPRENYTQFFQRAEKEAEEKESVETSTQRQIRLSREATVASNPNDTATSRVYIWDQDPCVTTFWRRRLLQEGSVDFEWEEHTSNQRKYWSHNNEWDLCGALPAYPLGEEPANSSGGVLEPKYGGGSSGGVPSRGVDEDDERDEDAPVLSLWDIIAHPDSPATSALPPNPPAISVSAYLSERHGYRAVAGIWEEHLHTGTKAQPKNAYQLCLQNLAFAKASDANDSPAPSPTETRGIANFCNVATSVSLYIKAGHGTGFTYSRLSRRCWDIPTTIDFTKPGICVRRATSSTGGRVLWVITPTRHWRRAPWCLATPSATAVLYAFRSSAATVEEMGSLLLSAGIPFYTVVLKRQPNAFISDWTGKPGFVGRRPAEKPPTAEDYGLYADRCGRLLKSRLGRAVRLRGGIAGRIAREFVADSEVLAGPYVGDLEVGSIDGCALVDDSVTDTELDIVCGVFHGTTVNEPVTHQSFWPKQSTWEVMCLSGDQWLPWAEDFYKQRVAAFAAGRFTFLTSTQWKRDHRYDVVKTQSILAGTPAIRMLSTKHVLTPFIQKILGNIHGIFQHHLVSLRQPVDNRAPFMTTLAEFCEVQRTSWRVPVVRGFWFDLKFIDMNQYLNPGKDFERRVTIHAGCKLLLIALIPPPSRATLPPLFTTYGVGTTFFVLTDTLPTTTATAQRRCQIDHIQAYGSCDDYSYRTVKSNRPPQPPSGRVKETERNGVPTGGVIWMGALEFYAKREVLCPTGASVIKILCWSNEAYVDWHEMQGAQNLAVVHVAVSYLMLLDLILYKGQVDVKITNYALARQVRIKF
ncbi:hypothetical protein BDN72DRAFT_862571 [Pluteus cervinus]|uniref:Uncharacterized protein n=1 Tax=Pluteus cervinus TaxID=181527 RepID=A0ACD3AB42_9AGAR|nr:hypothetical protein BDN72DRAFT_862571 [Pluteus cervinus]